MEKAVKILFLDDSPEDIELMRRELKKSGMAFDYEAVQSREGYEGALNKSAPDIILADYKLPSFDGLSALEISKNQYPGLPFIFVTGSMGEEWAIDSFRRGATDYVLKERLSRLVPSVRRALREVDERLERERIEGERIGLLIDIEGLFLSTVEALSKAIDAKSRWTMGHSERVTRYALAVAAEMGVEGRLLDDLRVAGLLHDIGKIGISDSVLDKPGRLDGEEFKMIKGHPQSGFEILGPIKQLRHIALWIKHHHESYDGRGYPDGLKGEDIPLMSRILAVADTFDAMTAERPYRATPGREKAISELKKFSGVQFDPEAAKVFIRLLEGGL